MGCFDFIYADNGENILARAGFLYTTKAFQHRTNTQSPLRFLSTNEYGIFQIRFKTHFIHMDIYALLAAQFYLADGPIDDTPSEHFECFLDCIKNKKLPFDKHPDDIEFQNSPFCKASDAIRIPGIQYFFAGCHSIKPTNVTIPALGPQKSKKIVCSKMYDHKIPLLISKKKLPNSTLHSDSTDVARNWGFVSCDDPHQGFFLTKNCYTIYRP